MLLTKQAWAEVLVFLKEGKALDLVEGEITVARVTYDDGTHYTYRALGSNYTFMTNGETQLFDFLHKNHDPLYTHLCVKSVL